MPRRKLHQSRLGFSTRFWQSYRTDMKSITLLCSVTIVAACGLASVRAADAPAKSGDLVPLVLKLPAPAFKGTPKDLPEGTVVEPLSDKPRPAIMVPPGCVNLAAGLQP